MEKDIFSQEDMLKLQEILRQNNQTITSAESCTGGLISYLITSISGSSDIFNGSLVSYSNEIKHKELNVSNEVLEKFGAVSKETVSQMLKGTLLKFSANYAIAVSGVAGPSGGSKKKPVGTVVIGICDDKDHQIVNTYHFLGTRQEVQMQAAKTSLKEILKFITKKLDK